MNSDKYRRTVSLICPTCGNTDFEHGDETEPVRCLRCNRVLTREELIQENEEVIGAEVDEMKSEIMQDLKNELRASLKNAFKGSKNIRFK